MYVMQPRLSKTMRLGVFEQFFCQGCAFFFWGGVLRIFGPTNPLFVLCPFKF